MLTVETGHPVVDPDKAARWLADTDSEIARLQAIEEFCAEQHDDAARELLNTQARRRVKLEYLAACGWTPPVGDR